MDEGAQRADVGSTRAIWAVQDKLALDADEEKAIELKREVVAGQERAVWNPALSLPPTEFGLTDAEIARIKTALETWDAYGASAGRRWLEPLLDVALRPVDGLDTSPPKSPHGGDMPQFTKDNSMASLVALTPTLPRAAPPADFHAAFADFLCIDVANGDASPDTVRSYRSEVAMWVAWCASQIFDPATVTAMHIKRYRQALIEGGYKPITIRWKLTIVRRFYEAARNAGLRADNPAAGVKSPRVRQATEDFNYLCDDQLDKFLAAIPNPDEATGREKVQRLRNLLMVSMMALQALRTIEVHRANAEDLTERGEHLVLLVRGKTRDRIAYLRPDMARRLKEYLALRGKVEPDGAGTPLFSAVGNHRGGKRLSRRHIRVQTDKYLRAAGLKQPGISNHALRHTAGTLGYLHTGDLRAVQDFMGHADPRMTAKYAHVVDMATKNPALFIPAKLRGSAS